MAMFGTKCPSITSTWIRSAPDRSASATCSPRRAKSAARIDGASLMMWFCIFLTGSHAQCGKLITLHFQRFRADRLTVKQSQARADNLLYRIHDRPQDLVGHDFVWVSCQAFAQRFSPRNPQFGIDVDDIDPRGDGLAKVFIIGA